MADGQRRGRTAPWYTIPSRRIVSVEHPGIVKNVDKAIDTLNGSSGISKILKPQRADTPANLNIRPEDPMARSIQSASLPSNNIVLKVTVPKWTGRKRKRESDEPFTLDAAAENERRTAKDRLRSLRDNEGKYHVEAVGMVDRYHVFRSMPDYVYSTTGSAFTQKFKEHILPFDYEKMKKFDIDLTRGTGSNLDLIPPPSLSHGDVPLNYMYRQNPAVKQSVDTSGKVTTVNTQQAPKVLTYLVTYDAEEVPSGPRESCPPVETLEPNLQDTIATIKKFFEQRPLWTRRALRNLLTTHDQRYCLRHAVPYVGYIFRSGPWRDAIVKFGHDPRSSPEYRQYQTIMFKLLAREAEVARDGGGRRHTLPRPAEAGSDAPGTSTSHLFTGQPPLPLDGKLWMVCDITDPLLRSMLFPPGPPPGFLRSTCDTFIDGWYGNGTMAKVKIIMRAKLQTLVAENRAVDDAEFDRIVAFPDHAVTEQDLAGFTLDSATASPREMQLATEIRGYIKSAPDWWGNVSTGKRQTKSQDVGTAETTETPEDTPSVVAADGKKIKVEDEDIITNQFVMELSEGEEEEREREEMMEETASAAAAAIESGQGDEEADEEMEESDYDDDDDENENEDDDEEY
ncbi:RNA polymerase III transcription factor subunit, putative [Paecilomyces variotii No. 5]|uniref:RNA polymerase III transcription factor subunit, putative n=1 Tax=Byssochlamys spectabilis (strain No. 5 / NBRC 109023) TaxID=1356009 RepID=V5HRQ0_BYSSN|nr:RNA polymerase III transcription factor subunit, putative [Paecilomyces variotii No. 5]